MSFAFPPFVVCGLDELADHRHAAITHALSILDPQTPVPRVLKRYTTLRHHWVLRFHDVAHHLPGASAPEAGDVETLLSFGQEVAQDRGGACRVLIHCHAGVSRSTAAALILLAQPHKGQETAALREVCRQRPGAHPNRRMVALADDCLGRGGRLLAALDEIY